jgi:hypothetical protein
VAKTDWVDGEQVTAAKLNQLGTDVNTAQSTANAKYSKPSPGIPATDMDAAVQTAINRANTALQPGGGEGGGPATWDAIEDKPTAFPPSAHTHDKGDISGLSTQVNALLDSTDAQSARDAIGAISIADVPTGSGGGGGTAVGYAANAGIGTTDPVTITHNLGTRDVHVTVYRTTSPWDEIKLVYVERTTTNTVTLKPDTTWTVDQFRVVVSKMVATVDLPSGGSVADGSITLAKLDPAMVVLSSEGIAANPNNTTIPTSLAVKNAIDASAGSGGSSGTSAFSSPVLAKMHSALAMAKLSRTCTIVACGSSTTEGQAATSAAARFFNRLIKAFQDAYPRDAGTHPAVVTSIPTGTLPQGILGVNLGLGGATSTTYITLTAGARNATDIGHLNPAVVIHQADAWDWYNQTDPATSKANIEARVAAIDAAATTPVLHIFLHIYPRWDQGGKTITWDTYANMVKDIVADDPNKRLFVDCTQDFKQIGIGYDSDRSDFRNFMYDVSVHMNNFGHAFFGDLLARKLDVQLGSSGGTAIGDTEAPTAPTLAEVSHTSTTITVSVSGATDNVGVTGYHFYNNGDRVTTGGPVAGPNYSYTGLTASTTYSQLNATAVDAQGLESPFSNTVSVTTNAAGGSGPVTFDSVGTTSLQDDTAGTNKTGTVNHTVGAGLTNSVLLVGVAVSHASWMSQTSIDTFTVTSNVGNGITTNFTHLSPSPVDDIGPSGQKQGSFHWFYLMNPIAGAHVLTVHVQDGNTFASVKAQSLSYSGVGAVTINTCTGANVTGALSVATTGVTVDDFALLGAVFNSAPAGFNKTTRHSAGAAVNGLADYILIGEASVTANPSFTTSSNSHYNAAASVLLQKAA